MRRSLSMATISMLGLWLAAAAVTAAPTGAAPAPAAARERSDTGEARRAEAGSDFEHEGAVVGDRVPDLDVVTIDGVPTRLSRLWRDKPTLLVTASLTCGRARERQPWVTELARKYQDRLNVAVLYTIEAHPVVDPSPYAEYSPELENPEHPGERAGGNEREGFAHRQPPDLARRRELAREFQALFEFDGPIVVDGMENQGWLALGGGPNMGFLIRRDGTIAVKHGWLDDATMERSIQHFLESAE